MIKVDDDIDDNQNILVPVPKEDFNLDINGHNYDYFGHSVLYTQRRYN